MPSNLTERLSTARRQRFVGRDAEKSIFDSALTSADLPFQIFFVYGPGGIGKTTLLHELADRAQAATIPAHYLDARNLEPSPEPFLNALQLALAAPTAPLEFLSAQNARRVILIDTFETLEPLAPWLREKFLPALNANTLLVIAGRNAPDAAWRADAGWQALLRAAPLRNLSPAESSTYLTQREIPAVEHQAVLDFTHGHPLALSLAADVFAQRPGFHFQPDEAPDMVKALLERFVQKAPSPAHRAALEASALVRVMNESLLAQMLHQTNNALGAESGAHELFNWLRDLSFIEVGREGLFPHDLAREALLADLRWRNPDWYKELHHRARAYYTARFQQTQGLEQQRSLYDYVFLHRDNPVIRSMLEWQPGTLIIPDSMREDDVAVCVAMVRQHEGDESAQWADKWLQRQPEGVVVYRDVAGQVLGFIAIVALEHASNAERHADPATRLAWEYLQRHAPLRPGEVAAHYRFWMARDTYQQVSPVQTLIFLSTVRYQLATPGLAYHFLPCAEPAMWADAFAYANLTRLPEIDYPVNGKRHGVYGHDWRTEPPLAWLQLLAEREVATGAPTASPPRAASPILVLSQEEFANAVRDALRDYPNTETLRRNALVQSKSATMRAGANATTQDRVLALQALLKEAAESLRATPRNAKFYRAVEQTYLQPAGTQEQIAEKLDLPFSTYRRHLKEGIERITELLWAQEIGH